MRDDDGLAGAVDNIHSGAITGVRHVDGDADMVHLPHHDLPELGEAGVGLLQAPASERAALVVCHLPDAQSEPVRDAHQGRVVLDLRREPLHPEDDSEPALALRAPDVLRGLDEDQPRLDLEVAVVPMHGAEQRPEIVGSHADAADPEGDVLSRDPAGDCAVEVGNAVDRLGHGLGDGQQHRDPLAVDEDRVVVNPARFVADVYRARHDGRLRCLARGPAGGCRVGGVYAHLAHIPPRAGRIGQDNRPICVLDRLRHQFPGRGKERDEFQPLVGAGSAVFTRAYRNIPGQESEQSLRRPREDLPAPRVGPVAPRPEVLVEWDHRHPIGLVEADAGYYGDPETPFDVAFDHPPSANLDRRVDVHPELPGRCFSELPAFRAHGGHDRGPDRYLLRCDPLVTGQRVVQGGDEHDVVRHDLAILQRPARKAILRAEHQLHLAVAQEFIPSLNG